MDTLTSGTGNVALGASTGGSLTSGSNNIFISNNGGPSDSGRIRIGNISTHTETFIAGISGNEATGGVTVLVNSTGELHTVVSSARFKEAVQDMEGTSELLMKLRPVSFRYREDVTGEEAGRDYGLIAEEVAEVAPELVAFDREGQAYSVRYHVLPSLLLNEMQNQHRTIEAQAAEIASLRAQQQDLLARQEQRIAALVARIERLEAGPQVARVGALR